MGPLRCSRRSILWMAKSSVYARSVTGTRSGFTSYDWSMMQHPTTSNCISSWITMPPTKLRRWPPGLKDTRATISILPPQAAPGSTRWNAGLPRLPNSGSVRGVFQSVDQLISAIDAYIAAHNQNPKPFVWTATAELILDKVTTLCQPTNRSPH